MSLELNADKQYIKGTNPQILGTSEFTVRSGTGTSEKELMRWQLDPTQQLTRVGINRNGQQVEKITLTNTGGGYSSAPSVIISAPTGTGGVQATASALINLGVIAAVVIDNPGNGYLSAPTISFTGGGGTGASATASLNKIEFELDVNGAIRTSTSIISDTARVINLDFVNLTTADGTFRAPQLKLYTNNTGLSWLPNTNVTKDTFRYFQDNIYRVKTSGTTGSNAPTHTTGTVTNGSTELEHVGFRVNSSSLPLFGLTGDGLFPRSVTPLQGDRSDKIATTEYVLGLATNDVGGRIYVSQQIGSDLNDGRSAVAPVRTIKKACQIATSTVGVRETVIVSGGDYEENNPISLPPDCSVVGDSLRIVNVRPLNAGKHMFKFADKNYITGITFRDKLNASGGSAFTWDFACVFDDRQRIYYDLNSGGDYFRKLPIGYQIFGRQETRVFFTANSATTDKIAVGETIHGSINGASATVIAVSYNATTGDQAFDKGFVDVVLNPNSNQLDIGADFLYGGPATTLGTFTVPWVANTAFAAGVYLWVAGTTGTAGRVYVTTAAITTGASVPVHTTGTQSNLTYVRDRFRFTSTTSRSIRAEGEVVEIGQDLTTEHIITRIDASSTAYNTYGGVVIYTNSSSSGNPVGVSGIHNFKEGEEIEITGLPTSSPDLSWLNGKQRVYKFIEDADSRSRRIVISKQGSRVGFTDSNFSPSSVNATAKLKSYSHYITLSLLNSPNKFRITDPVGGATAGARFQDACTLIRNNVEFIKDETYQIIADDFHPNFNISSIKTTSGTGLDLGKVILEITTSAAHGFHISDDITIKKLGSTFANNLLNGDYTVTNVIGTTVLQVQYAGTITSLGLTSGSTYTFVTAPSLGQATQGTVGQFSFSGTAVTGNQSYTNIAQSTSSGSGNGATFNVSRSGGVYTSVTVNNTGAGYIPGDTITIPGTSLGGTSANNITVKLASIGYRPNLQRKFSTPNEAKCRRDIGHLVNAIIMDLEYGGNYHVVEAAKRYRTNGVLGYVGNELAWTVRSINVARLLCLYAMRNWNLNSGLYNQIDYVPQFSTLPRYVDGTVSEDTSGAGSTGFTCSNVASAIDTLAYLYADILSNKQNPNTPSISTRNDAGYLIMRNADFIASEALGFAKALFPTLGLTSDQERKCKRDIRIVLQGLTRDIIAGGNSGIVTAAESYFTGATLTGLPANELTATRYAFTKVAELAILAMRNWKTGTDGTGALYIPVHETVIPLQREYGPVGNIQEIVLVDPAANKCATIVAAINTEMGIFDSILSGSVTPGTIAKTYGTLYDPTITYPENVMVDQDGFYITPRGRWDDLPFIEGSPYIQNASVISFLGGGGCEIDGSKVKSPNCPFPGLEQDGKASNPNQGKSMVAAQFTIVSFGGVGYKINNDGYAQLVSVFVLFCADGVLAESGGYVSITNAATNFGLYALRAVGYRKDPYVFDVGKIKEISETITGRTILKVELLGRKPLEHYVIKIPGYVNQTEAIEYTIEKVTSSSIGPIFESTFEVNAAMMLKRSSDNVLFNAPLSTAEFVGKTINFLRPSIVNSSGHTWEYAGSGINYNALPENGGIKKELFEQVSENYGRVYTSGTDELGDFKVGYFAKIENRTGNITFTGTVSISEVEFLKLKGGDVVVTGFSADNTLGGANALNSLLPTQKAVKDYITTNLGSYVNKPFSTNAIPRALVELTDSGKISIDQIPALRPFSVFTVADQSERLNLEGALAGDIAIQADTSTSFILNNDLSSLFAAFPVNTSLQFTINNLFTSSPSGAQIQAKEYRQGVVFQINLTNAGSGYTQAPNISFSNPQQSGGVLPTAVATIANGQVTSIKITSNGGIFGGRGYTSAPTITIASPGGAGITATAIALLESRLYGDITNNKKVLDTDTILSSNSTPVLVDISRVVNTSSFIASNWVSLSSNQVAADQITSGVISTSRLATNAGAANSFTFLRGDQSYVKATQTIRGTETRYFVKTSSSTGAGGQQLFFTESNAALILKGHNIPTLAGNGIAPGTSVTSITLNAGLYTVNINNPTSQLISAGSIVEFSRPTSPLVIDTPLTDNNYISTVVIVSPGSGFTNGVYTNVGLQGGSGTGLRADITVTAGEISSVTVIEPGNGYNEDFTITGFSTSLGTFGVGLVLSAKKNSVLKYAGNIILDVTRVSDSAIDTYSTVGVARFLRTQNTTNEQAGFIINADGNGSIAIKTGQGSGLNADKLDNQDGGHYLNGVNFNVGSIGPDKLTTGKFNIDCNNAETSKLITALDQGSSDPLPSGTGDAGVRADLRNNSANGLNDGGTRNFVLNLRNGIDASYGGVRQLSFTDNNNLWLRGSGTSLTAWSSWFKIWHSGNDASTGSGSGPDAFRLSNKLEEFYRTAYNINVGQLSDNRIPFYQTAKAHDDNISIRWQKLAIIYDFYIPNQLLSGAPNGNPDTNPFSLGKNVKLFQPNGVENGVVQVTSVSNNAASVTDTSLRFSIVRARVVSGAVIVGGIQAVKIGADISNSVVFADFTITTDNTIEVAKLQSTSGTALLKLGRVDGVASSPAIHFNSSDSAATYNVALISSGGTSTTGSGSLNIVAGSTNAVTINNNKIWNEGNLTFSTGISGSSYAAEGNGKAAIRDGSGNIAFNSIIGTLTGSASLNVLKAGDTMTGNLNWGTTGFGLTWGMNTDGASIKFYNTGDSDADSRLEFQTTDNNNEYFRWTHLTGSTTYESMRLVPNSDTNAELRVRGFLNVGGDPRTAAYAPLTVRIKNADAPTSGDQGYFATAVLEKQSATWNRLRFDRSGKAEWGVASNPNSNFVISRLTNAIGTNGTADDDNFCIKLTNGFVGIQTEDPQYQLQVVGSFAATSKSFCISHPTKENHNLVYGSLEGPEHAVYVRGKASNVITLPDYWTALVDENTITVQLTAIGNHAAWVEKIENNKIFIGGGESFYFVQAERKDIEPLEVEVELPVELPIEEEE